MKTERSIRGPLSEKIPKKQNRTSETRQCIHILTFVKTEGFIKTIILYMAMLAPSIDVHKDDTIVALEKFTGATIIHQSLESLKQELGISGEPSLLSIIKKPDDNVS